MKLLFLLIGLSLAFRIHAQEGVLHNRPVEVKTPNANVAEALRGSANPHYMVLKHVTPVYHQPADTVNRKHVFKLFPGTKVYIREWVPGGVLIDLGFNGGERYYLPEKSMKGLQTFVEI